MRKIVGYPVENFSHSADVLVSTDENDNLPCAVELWRDTRPEKPSDVGRTLEGEIVWVKKIDSSKTPARTVSIIPPRSKTVDRDPDLQHVATPAAPFLEKQASTVGKI
jgi:hypothetical protein